MQKTPIEWTGRYGPDGLISQGYSCNIIKWRRKSDSKTVFYCIKKSSGCAGCYSERLGKQWNMGFPFQAKYIDEVEPWFDEREVNALLRLNDSEPGAKVFVGDMTDVYLTHDFGDGRGRVDLIPDEMLDRMYATFALCQNLTFQVLTKRPDRRRAYLSAEGLSVRLLAAMLTLPGMTLDKLAATEPKNVPWPLPNVWEGTSVEDQKAADERIVELLRTPAVVRFLSCEPLISAVKLRELKSFYEGHGRPLLDLDSLSGWHRCGPGLVHKEPGKIDWVIVGGESGPEARPMHPRWAEDLRDECRAAKVPFFFKQWGGWSPISRTDAAGRYILSGGRAIATDGTVYDPCDLAYDGGSRYGEALRAGHDKASLTMMYPMGKKAAGRLLDGREWNEFPEVGK